MHFTHGLICLNWIEYGEKLLAMDPGNLQALVTLPNVILTSLPTDATAKSAALTKASDYAKKLLAVAKPAGIGDADWAGVQAQARFTVGFGLFSKNAYAEAITEFQEAIKLNKKDDQTHYNLGLAYNALLPDAQRLVLAGYDEENAAKTALKPQAEIDAIVAKRAPLEADFRARRDLAIDAFARAAALAGPTSASARTQFERLFKQKKADATADEMNQYIAAKKAELG